MSLVEQFFDMVKDPVITTPWFQADGLVAVLIAVTILVAVLRVSVALIIFVKRNRITAELVHALRAGIPTKKTPQDPSQEFE